MTPEYRIETEKRIKQYLKPYKVGRIDSMKLEQTFNDQGQTVNVWDIKTSKDPLWIVEGEHSPMNLYTQGASYLSADEAYSYHLGITARLENSHKTDFKHVIDELPLDIGRLKSINRKLNMAATKLSIELEPEEFQAIGLICRESLVDLGKELYRNNKELLKGKSIKQADFKGIADEIVSLYIPGQSNADIRTYSKKIIDIAWSYNSQVVHSQNKTYPDVNIALLFTCTAISLIENLFYKFIGFDKEGKCEKCGSKNQELIDLGPHGVVVKCNVCEDEYLVKPEKVIRS